MAALAALLTAARGGDRAGLDEAAARLEDACRWRADLAVEAATLAPALDPERPAPPAVARWRAGEGADVPAGLHGVAVAPDDELAGDQPLSYVLATPSGPARRLLGGGVRLFAARRLEPVFAQPARAAGISTEELFERDRSVLDFVRGDLAAMQLRLAGAEREKLGQFTESLRALEQQLAPKQRGGSTCQAPARPSGTYKLQREMTPEPVEGLVDVAAQAIACGMTRVVTLSMHGFEGPDNPWPFLGLKNPHLHSHDGDHALMTKLEQYCFGRVAQLLQRLAPYREGAGTLADQTLALCVNAGGGEHHNGAGNHAVVLVGTAGGAIRGGRAMVLPARSRNVADVYCSVATAVGAPMSSFGVPEHCKGPLPLG